MVRIETSPSFEKDISKIRDNTFKEKIGKQIQKIIDNPDIGKPMRFDRKGTRELYVSPYRLSYNFDKEKDVIYLLRCYHKDEQ